MNCLSFCVYKSGSPATFKVLRNYTTGNGRKELYTLSKNTNRAWIKVNLAINAQSKYNVSNVHKTPKK